MMFNQLIYTLLPLLEALVKKYHNSLANSTHECQIINLSLVSWFDSWFFNSKSFNNKQ